MSFQGRLTEIPESDVFICQSLYDEINRQVQKLGIDGVKKYSHTPGVTEDEIYYYPKLINPLRVSFRLFYFFFRIKCLLNRVIVYCLCFLHDNMSVVTFGVAFVVCLSLVCVCVLLTRLPCSVLQVGADQKSLNMMEVVSFVVLIILRIDTYCARALFARI